MQDSSTKIDSAESDDSGEMEVMKIEVPAERVSLISEDNILSTSMHQSENQQLTHSVSEVENKSQVALLKPGWGDFWTDSDTFEVHDLTSFSIW